MRLLKFCTLNKNSIISLANNSLWFSELNNLNDPFEGKHYITSELISNDVLSTENMDKFEKYILEQTGLNLEHITYELHQKNSSRKDKHRAFATVYLNKLIDITRNKVLSMSGDNKEQTFTKSNLMWSHYGDGLKGFCLVFDTYKLRNSLEKLNDSKIYIENISYQENVNEISLEDFYKIAIKGENYAIKKLYRSVLTKSKVWEYENEYRILTKGKENHNKYSSDSLLEIIIGCKMPEVEQELVKNLVKKNYPDALLKIANISEKSYELEIKDIN